MRNRGIGPEVGACRAQQAGEFGERELPASIDDPARHCSRQPAYKGRHAAALGLGRAAPLTMTRNPCVRTKCSIAICQPASVHSL